MKTSSKIILEDMKLSNEFRFDIELLQNDRMKSTLYSIMSNLDDINNKQTKESDKLFALKSVVNDFIEVTNALVTDYLFKSSIDLYKKQKTIEKLKSFLEVDKELSKKTSKSKEPELSPKEKEIMRKLNL
mgnify:FL=1